MRCRTVLGSRWVQRRGIRKTARKERCMPHAMRSMLRAGGSASGLGLGFFLALAAFLPAAAAFCSSQWVTAAT